MKTARVRAYLMLLVVAIIWGIASPIIKFTLDVFSPAVFLTYRYAISTLLALIFIYFGGLNFPKSIQNKLWLLLYAFLNGVLALGMLFFGMKNTTVLDMSLITLLLPLSVSLAGFYYLREKITKKEKIGMTIAILGTAITIIEPLVINGGNQIEFSGNLLIFGYVVNATICAVIAKKLLRNNTQPMTLVNTTFMIGFVSFLIYTLSQNLISIPQILATPLKYHLGVWYMAIVSGTLAFYLSNKAQKTIEISEQSLFSYLSPIFAMPIAVLWLGEKITPIFVVGAIIITVGVAIAEVKARSNVKN